MGCSIDDDCGEGLGCEWLDDKPTCLDIDECVQDPDICSDTPGTACRNLISSYRYSRPVLTSHVKFIKDNTEHIENLHKKGAFLSV